MLLDAKNQRIETVNRFKNLLPLDNRTKYHLLPLYSNSRPKVERKYYPLSTSRFHEMIWHASRRHIHICVWRGSLLLVYLSFFIATIIRLEMVGEMRLISSIGARILREKRERNRWREENNGERASGSWNEERQLPKGEKLVATRVWKGQVSSTKVYQPAFQPSPRRPIFTARPAFSLDSAVEFSLINSPNLRVPRSIFIRGWRGRGASKLVGY